MKRLMATVALGLSMTVGGVAVAQEDKITKGFYSYDAMGCMLLKECTDGVEKIKTTDVHLADEKYFPVGHRGVYHTVSNHFYLNKTYVHRPHVLMSVVRHEGWHAAQDCMAGTIKNNLIAIIHNEEDVPKYWAEIATSTYRSMPHAIPWEKEAFWAGHTEGMTQAALESCARGKMWEKYSPTPMTKEWLVENGYINP